MAHRKTSSQKSIFIALTGVMGVGKSSLACALADRIGYTAFIEPEADAWPVPVNQCWEDHVFALEQWVRQTNLSLFTQARLAADSGNGSVADGGLFMLAREYMDDPACGFYYDLFTASEKLQLRNDAASDWRDTPVPDILIVVEAEVEIWRHFLMRRARSMDENHQFIASYAGQQRVIRSAAEKYAHEKNVRLTVFKLQSTDLEDNATSLLDFFAASGVILPRA